MAHHPPISVLGLPVHPVSMNQAVLRIEAHLDGVPPDRSARPFVHVALNGPKWMACQDNPDLARGVREADLVTADGVGVLALARRLGHRLPERVTGIDLMDALCARAASRGWPVALLGGREGVASAASTELRRRYRRLAVSYTHHGYFGPEDDERIASEVASTGARLLFVGMQTPRKEDFVTRHAAACGVDFAMGVGGAFDVLGGPLKRAPRLLQDLGLEWAWRWAQEPQRLARRYGWDGARFVIRTVRGRPPIPPTAQAVRARPSVERAS